MLTTLQVWTPVCQVDVRCMKNKKKISKSSKNSLNTIGFKIEHAKSMGGVEKVMKLVAKTDGLLMWSLTTLQVWRPEATISL